MKTKLSILFFIVCFHAISQTIFIKGYQYIYYFDLSTCTATDSVKIDNNTFDAIALNSDGNIYGSNYSVTAIYKLNPVTKAINIQCSNLSTFTSRASVGACFDKQNNLLLVDYDFILNKTFVYKFNINTCSVVTTYTLDTILGIDGDLEYNNDILYITSRCAIWQIDLRTVNPKPIKVFNSNYPYDNSAFNGYYGVIYTCFQDKISFFVSNYEAPVTKLYRYDAGSQERILHCVLPFYCYDAANYSPDANFFYLGPDTAICSNTFSMTLKTNIPTAEWSTGQIGEAIQVANGGTYWAKVSTSCGTYIDTIKIITPTSIVPLSIGRDTIICPNTSITLHSNLPNTKWWDNTIGQSINMNVGGIYWASYKDSCSNYTDTISIENYIPPIPINIGIDTSVCIGTSITTYSNIPNTIWQDGSIADTFNSIISNSMQISGIVANKCLSSGFDNAIRNINTIEESIMISGYRNTLCPPDDSILLEVTLDSVKWILPDNSFLQNVPMIYANQIGTYKAVINGKCTQLIDSIVINESCKNTFEIYIPTAFSPNNDGINDEFNVFIKNKPLKFNLQIYNRWGQIIFESNDINTKWNGYYKEDIAQVDNYVYILEVTQSDGSKQQKQGIITLIK